MANSTPTSIQVSNASNPDLQNWSEGLNPTQAYKGMSDQEAVNAFFGDVNKGMGFAAFACVSFARLGLRQANNPFNNENVNSIAVGTKVVCLHSASSLLAARFTVVEYDKTPDFDTVRELFKSGEFTWGACVSILTAVESSFEYTTFIPECWFETVSSLDADMTNIVTIPDSWGTYLNFSATLADAAILAKSFAGTANSSTVKFLRGAEFTDGHDGQFFLMLDQVNILRIDADGVWDHMRNRRFGNVLFDCAAGLGSLSDRTADQLYRTNSYGTFIYALLSLGCGKWDSPSALFRSMTDGVYAPLSNLEEVGVMDADRVRYDKYCTVAKVATMEVPFAIRNSVSGKVVTSRKEAIAHDYSSVPGKFISGAASEHFNLSMMPQGQFVDGRNSVLRFKDIPEGVLSGVLTTMFNNAQVCLLTWTNETFDFDFATKEQAITWLASNAGICQSSKVAKAIKRCEMSNAQVGFMKYGESRCFSQVAHHTDLGASKNNVAVEAVISLSHATFAAGTACYMVDPSTYEADMDKLTMIVRHTQSSTIPATFTGDLEKDVILLFPGDEVVRQGKWMVAKFVTPKFLAPGEVVALVPFTTEEGSAYLPVTSNQKDGFLSEVRWCLTSGYGKQSVVTVKIVTLTNERELKVRNNIKAMMTQAPMSLIHNGLNDGIIAKAVFPRDTNKWTDNNVKFLDVAALTFIKNNDAEGIALIAKANKEVGYEAVDMLVFSPLVSAMGGYEAILKYFSNKFSRAVWTKVQDSSNGEFTSVLKQMYQPWTELQMDVFPVGATNTLLMSESTTVTDKTNLLGFYTLNGGNFILQRGLAFAGTKETGPVWQPMKGEMSSVSSIVGTTPMMAGVARAITKANPELGAGLVKEGYDKVHLAGAFQQMIASEVVGATELVQLEDVASMLSDELKADMKNWTKYSGLLKSIATELSGVTIQLAGCTLYVPAVWSQSNNEGFGSYKGLSDLVQVLVTCLALGDVSEVVGLQRRIFGAMKTTAKGKSLGKSAAYGSFGVQAKAIAPVVGIPVGELWVRESGSERSVYKTFQRRYGKDVDGMTVAMTRAPMVTPLYAKVVVIHSNHWAYCFVGEFTVACSPLAMMLNGGDFDGDNVAMYKVAGIPCTTLDDLKKSITTRTGSDQLVPGGSYWGDHFELLSYEAQQKKSGMTLGSFLKNIVVTKDTQESHAKGWARKYNFPSLLRASAECLQEFVGWVHLAFLTAETSASLANELNYFEGTEWAKVEGLNEVLAEIYEVPLGGLDWNAYDYFSNHLVPTILTGEVGKGVSTALNKAGMNGEFSTEISKSLVHTYNCRSMMSEKSCVSTKEEALRAVVQLSVLISKNKVDEKSEHMIHGIMAWANENRSEWVEMVATSPIMGSVSTWISVVHGNTKGLRSVEVDRFVPTSAK